MCGVDARRPGGAAAQNHVHRIIDVRPARARCLQSALCSERQHSRSALLSGGCGCGGGGDVTMAPLLNAADHRRNSDDFHSPARPFSIVAGVPFTANERGRAQRLSSWAGMRRLYR